MTSDTARRNASLVSKCLFWDATPQFFQYRQDGSVLEVHKEKMLCPEKIVSVSASWCWKREVLRLERVPCLFSPVEDRGRPGQACVCATPTPLHAKNVFVPSLCLQWVLPFPRCYQHCHMLLFFFAWFRYCSPLWALLFPHFPAGWQQLRP